LKIKIYCALEAVSDKAAQCLSQLIDAQGFFG